MKIFSQMDMENGEPWFTKKWVLSELGIFVCPESLYGAYPLTVNRAPNIHKFISFSVHYALLCIMFVLCVWCLGTAFKQCVNNISCVHQESRCTSPSQADVHAYRYNYKSLAEILYVKTIITCVIQNSWLEQESDQLGRTSPQLP